jgi:hypothetical protein
MLDAALPCIDGFLVADAAWYVSRQRQPLTTRLVRNGKVRVARRPIVDVDEVDTLAL